MIRVIVNLIGSFKNLIGKERLEITIAKNSRLKTAFEVLHEMSREKIDPFLSLNNENQERNMIILLNDVEIGLLQGLKTNLHDNDVLTLIPITHGG